MKTYLECIPCFVRQATEAVQLATSCEEKQVEFIQKLLEEISQFDLSLPPPHIGQKIHRLIKETTGNTDPYQKIKERINREALALLPHLRQKIKESDDPFEMAVRYSIAGNIMDSAAKGAIGTEEIERDILDATSPPLDKEEVAHLKEEITKAKSILFLGDNAGEIVLDRLLIEKMPREKITYVVRGAPTINDATFEDARASGITELATVIDNGSDAPGTILGDCSEDFQRRFWRSDLIISKGQGNYESLSDVRHNIFFLFKVKCHVVEKEIRLPVGSLVVKGQKYKTKGEK